MARSTATTPTDAQTAADAALKDDPASFDGGLGDVDADPLLAVHRATFAGVVGSDDVATHYQEKLQDAAVDRLTRTATDVTLRAGTDDAPPYLIIESDTLVARVPVDLAATSPQRTAAEVRRKTPGRNQADICLLHREPAADVIERAASAVIEDRTVEALANVLARN